MKIFCIGGGTGGHILPLKNLIETLLSEKHKVTLVTSDTPLDQKIVDQNFNHLKLNHIGFQASKIHYHFAFSNVVNIFKILASFGKARKILKAENPDVLFFKGGFVGFPFLIAAKFLMQFEGTIYLHESDISAGRLTQFFEKYADQVFRNFGASAMPLFYMPQPLPAKKAFKKPQILVFGGSQGAQFINELIITKAEILTKTYDIMLVTGPGKNTSISQSPHLKMVESLPQDRLIQEMINADLVITRSGSSLFQVLATQTPSISIPLPTVARNHQYHNAKYFAERGLTVILQQNEKTKDQLIPTIEKTLADKTLQNNLQKQKIEPKPKEIAAIITSQ